MALVVSVASLRNTYRNSVRRLLPKVTLRYAGVRVRPGERVGERLVKRLAGLPATGGDNPEYEAGLAEGIRSYVCPGDRVVIIGGGWGVTAALAAQTAGPTGAVVCFEGGAEQVEAISDTASLNGVRVDARHAFVGVPDNVYGSLAGAQEMPVAELPDCDVLEMDCEGAELEIVRNMTIRPRDILVETHSCTSAMRDLLKSIGYVVEDRARLPDRAVDIATYEKNDVFVLFAHRQ